MVELRKFLSDVIFTSESILDTAKDSLQQFTKQIRWNTSGKLCFKYVPFSDKLDQTPLNAAKYEADFLTSLQLNSPAFKKYITFDCAKRPYHNAFTNTDLILC